MYRTSNLLKPEARSKSYDEDLKSEVEMSIKSVIFMF